MKALVLCGGLGTRLGNLTERTPKPLLPIDGRPLLAYTLRLLALHGVQDVAINTHFMPEAIESAIGSGERYGVRVQYAHEATLLGTAGTVRRLEPFFGDDEEALVVYGDLLFDEDMSAMRSFHRSVGASGTLMLHRRARSNSIVTLDEASRRILGFAERPAENVAREPHTWVNSGVAILSKRLRSRIPEAVPSDLPRDVYSRLSGEEALFGWELRGYRCAIDSPARYEEAQRAVREGLVCL